jgi:hypothetical protein
MFVHQKVVLKEPRAYVKAWQVATVSDNYVNELIRRVVVAENDFAVVNFWREGQEIRLLDRAYETRVSITFAVDFQLAKTSRTKQLFQKPIALVFLAICRGITANRSQVVQGFLVKFIALFASCWVPH